MEEERGAPLQFRVLGPMEVTRHGEALPFRGTREQALLALLVLNANRTVAAERLTEELWTGEPPEGAIRSLRVYVSRLRQALGPDGQAVVTRPSGYVLQVAPETVDAVRFEALVARGRDHARGGDNDRAARTFREALTLWRGPALADVADAPFARAEATRLEEARLAAVEDRIEADLACGRHGEVAAELEALTGEHPFRERLWSQRIIALYRSGRQADALRAYQQLRSTLAEQLGIEPSPALQQLEGAVLRHDPALEWPPTGERVATAPGRLPPPLVRRERLPLVGREVELSRLDELWQATCSGQRHLVLMAGEPGIGKSRLAAEFARTAHGAGAPVLFGRCDEGMGVPYQPFVEALGRYLRQGPPLLLGRLAGELVRLVPDVAERVDGLAPLLRSDPETERYRLFDAVAAWLIAVSEAAPVLFVVEDLHWATKPTLLLLSHLLRSDEDLRLLVLVTFRDTPLDMSPDLADLVAELLRLPGVERLRLTGLDEPGVGALMEAQAGHDLDDDGRALARIVHDETAGNPFYVREMLSLLAEKGAIVRRDGRWVPGLPLAQLDVPDSVRDVVERRLTRLPDRTSEMLAVAAVLGERFDLAVLAEASGASETSVVDTLRPAVSARLVNETDAGRYQFIHALVRSALEDALGPTRRLQLHRAAGSAIEAVHAGHLDAHLPQLAHHFARARDVERAVDYASQAGDRALAQLANDEAAGYYRQALELLEAGDGDPGLRLQILISLGEAQRRGGDSAYRETLLSAAGLAQERGDVGALARAALANTRGGIPSANEDPELIATLDAALELVPSDDKATRARLLANLGVEVVFLPERDPAALSNQALGLARDLDDATLAHVLRTRYYTITRPETRQERWANTRELLETAERLGDPAMLLQAHYFRARSSMEIGDLEEFDRSLAVAERLGAELGQPTLQWVNTWQRIGRVILAGRFEEAERLSNQALNLGESSGQNDAYIYFMLQRFAVLFEQGRLATLLVPFSDFKANNPTLSFLEAMLALLHVELGDDDHASLILERWEASNFDALPRDVTRIRAMTSFAVVAAHLGKRASAGVLYDLLVPHRDQIDTMAGIVAGAVVHYLGLLATTIGDFAEADVHFATAAATHEAISAPAWLARTRLEWARMLLIRRQPGDAERALGLLGQALETARELGLATIEREAANLLASP